MTALELVQYLTWIVYIAIFLVVIVQAIRAPYRANIDIALLLGVPAFVIADSVLANLGLLRSSTVSDNINGTLILAISYILLRLVADFAEVHASFMRAMEASLILLCAGLFVFALPRPVWLTILQVLYFVGLQLYAAVMFVRASFRATGVTRRRMSAVATGSLFMGLTILAASLASLSLQWMVVSQLCGLASGIAYFLGFAPPRILRRAWQEPELRAFLGRAARLPRLGSTEAIIREIERGTATALGAPASVVGLWVEETQKLHFTIDGTHIDIPATSDSGAGQCFITQQPIFVADVPRTYPASAERSRTYRSRTSLLAPITAGGLRLGVLTVYAPRAPIFAADDLALIQLLADQAAVVLESRALIDEATRVQAREEVTRLKDDFLLAAAHDLKTPLTTVVARAELLVLRARRRPDAPADLNALDVLWREAKRLQNLVLELLDATRAERGQLVGPLESIDLRVVGQEACERHDATDHPCVLQAKVPVVGAFDRSRIEQLLDNLIENAQKYSLQGSVTFVRVWQEDDTGRITVTDRGIGIPQADLPHIFDRFYRATNVDHKVSGGIGLGLFICKTIVEQHGGHIVATSKQGQGTTFDIRLPLLVTDVEHITPVTSLTA